MKIIELDVRELEHPVPLQEAMKAFKFLKVGEVVHMIHRKEPLPLFSLLRKHNGEYHCICDESGVWHILFTKDKTIDIEKLNV